MKLPQLTRVPEADNRVVGMANIRGTMVPVIALKRSLGLGEHEVDLAKLEAKENGILIITEYNGSLQAFHVAAVDRIIRTSWSQIKTPPALVFLQQFMSPLIYVLLIAGMLLAFVFLSAEYRISKLVGFYQEEAQNPS